MNAKQIKTRLEYLRGELRAERISQGELCELQSLVDHIAADDVELRKAAGIPENSDLTAYKITRDDGSHYITSMARGVTLEDARKYFLGIVQVEEDFKTGKETKLTVTNVEQVTT